MIRGESSILSTTTEDFVSETAKVLRVKIYCMRKNTMVFWRRGRVLAVEMADIGRVSGWCLAVVVVVVVGVVENG